MPGNPIGRLRLLGALEGASFLLLLGIAMPLKYLAGLPAAVQIVGWAHGLLFILFVAAVAECWAAGRLDWRHALGALVAAVLPFGPFVFDARLRRADAAAVGGTPAIGTRPQTGGGLS